MKRSEKRQMISDYCMNLKSCESGCRLYNNFIEQLGGDRGELHCLDENADIDANFRIIFGEETVNHPAHYQGKHECIDEMIALFGKEAVKAFCRCNVYKYRYRAEKKNGAEDLAKADWYMDKLMELEEQT